jgi:hypothetical protein
MGSQMHVHCDVAIVERVPGTCQLDSDVDCELSFLIYALLHLLLLRNWSVLPLRCTVNTHTARTHCELNGRRLP